ncbi:MAG: PKD domain-containing protein, partial [Desulfobacteraceae bacterium]|nr:PKD domain-containing protein [Desulfobacteraceae bacterium]
MQLYDFESGAQGWTVAGDAMTSCEIPSIPPLWTLNTSLPGTIGQVLPTTWWTNPNYGQLGAERSHVTSPVLTASGSSVSINFDSYSSNESGYPTYFDVEHVQISINGSVFSDVHGSTLLLHQWCDRIFRNITFTTTGLTPGDLIQYRFLYDTCDACCGCLEVHSWAFDNVLVTGASENEPPTADANGLYQCEAGSEIAFDGTGSSDPDGDSLTYDWDFGDTNTGTGATPSHSYSDAGIYDVCLTVTDPGGLSDTACTIAVVYDPSAGFVTGGGWIDSPEGAYMPGTIVANGSFETGDYTSWTLWEGGASPDPQYGTWGIAQDGQVVNYGDSLFDYFDGVWNTVYTPGTPITFEASDGDYVAFNLQTGSQTHRMYQDITIPDECDIYTLSWDMKYDNHAGYFDPVDQYLAVHIRDTSDNILETLYKTTQGVDPLVLPMTSFSKDISAYAGTTVRLDVEAVVNLFFLDALAFDNFAVDFALTGKANFGFVSKYKKGAQTPEGNTEFVFKAGEL